MSRDEDEFWASKILDARHSQLDTVRKAAAGWSALFTAVLGVFGTVTFASGLGGLDDLTDGTRNVVKTAIAIAALAALAATILAGSVANSMPRVTNDLTVSSFQAETKRRAVSALRRLRWAMNLGALAAAVVITGSLVVLFAAKSSTEDKLPTLVAVVDGKTYCGTPAWSTDGTLSLSGVSLNGTTSLIIVPACPKGS